MSQEIHNLIDSVYEAWNAGDAAAYAALFTEDADYITYLRPAPQGQAGHREAAPRPLQDADQDRSRGRAVRPDAERHRRAGDRHRRFRGDGEREPGRDSVVTYTAVHTPEGWRFASFQNTRVGRP